MIKSFSGVIPTRLLPSGLSDKDLGELFANLVGLSAKSCGAELPTNCFTFLLTVSPSPSGIEVGLASHQTLFYEKYNNLLLLFFQNQLEWKKQVEMLPEAPIFSGGISLGHRVPHVLLINKDGNIKFTSALKRLVTVSFPANVSTVLNWYGSAANGCFFDVKGDTISEDKEKRLLHKFQECMETGDLFPLDDIRISGKSKEEWDV